MTHYRILGISMICLFATACDTQEQITSVANSTEIIIAPVKIPEIKTASEIIAKEKTTVIKVRPAINLSIDNMHIDHHIDDDNFLNAGIEPTDNTSPLFETLGENQIQRKINLSGKLLTDEDKIDNKEYLESVDGVQINIEGSFN